METDEAVMCCGAEVCDEVAHRARKLCEDAGYRWEQAEPERRKLFIAKADLAVAMESEHTPPNWVLAVLGVMLALGGILALALAVRK